MPEQDQQDDDGNGNAKQPKQNCGHVFILRAQVYEMQLRGNRGEVIKNKIQ
jgi:hypothetical protein